MHYIHLGRVGLVANFRWIEIFDFATGFIGMDVSHDDGRDRGYWSWLAPDEEKEDAAPADTSKPEEPTKDAEPELKKVPKKNDEWIS